jgi:hypothetical protein
LHCYDLNLSQTFTVVCHIRRDLVSDSITESEANVAMGLLIVLRDALPDHACRLRRLVDHTLTYCVERWPFIHGDTEQFSVKVTA